MLKTAAFATLHDWHAGGRKVALWDYDGHLHEHLGQTLHGVIHNAQRPLGHAFVLLWLLEHGGRLDLEALAAETSLNEAGPPDDQLALF